MTLNLNLTDPHNAHVVITVKKFYKFIRLSVVTDLEANNTKSIRKWNWIFKAESRQLNFFTSGV